MSVHERWFWFFLVGVILVYFSEAATITLSVHISRNNPTKSLLFEEEGISYHIFTREEPRKPRQLLIEEFAGKPHFNNSKPILFFVHGWMHSVYSLCCMKIRDAFLASVDGNVIVVDWSDYARKIYPSAVKEVEPVGRQIAQFVKNMKLSAHPNVTMVGHSLGAHIVGITGYHTRGTLKKIFGLDPALPEFVHVPVEKRISKLSAEYVQIIHTSLLGFKDPIGHADFYPNSGGTQPGCSTFWPVCSHSRSWEYYAESLNPQNKFRASLCENHEKMINHECVETDRTMGGIATDARGIYYLETNPSSPYAKG